VSPAEAALRELHRPADHGRVMYCCAGCEELCCLIERDGENACCHEYDECPVIALLDELHDKDEETRL
jgi:hypothetical protein